MVNTLLGLAWMLAGMGGLVLIGVSEGPQLVRLFALEYFDMMATLNRTFALTLFSCFGLLMGGIWLFRHGGRK